MEEGYDFKKIRYKTNKLQLSGLDYEQKADELNQLLVNTPKLKADPANWDIEGCWDNQFNWNLPVRVHFIDAVYMPLFHNYYNFDCRTIKIINFNKPAIRITFYKKHRYSLLKDKDITTSQKTTYIQNYINSLWVKIERLKGKMQKNKIANIPKTLGEIANMTQEAKDWQQLLTQIDYFDMAISNYHQQIFYSYINYKYRFDETTLANEQEHLLNHKSTHNFEFLEYCHNIVFVDTADILKEHPYQNKEIDKFLASFPHRSEFIKDRIYLRPKPHPGEIEAFEQVTSTNSPASDLNQPLEASKTATGDHITPKAGSNGKKQQKSAKKQQSSSSPLFPDLED